MESTSFPNRDAFSPLDLLELSPTPMVIVRGESYEIAGLNGAAAEMFGAEPIELVEQPLCGRLAFDFDQSAPMDKSGICHGVGYLWGTGTEVQPVHLDYRTVDGEVPLTVISLFDGSRVSDALREELEAARTDATTGALRRDSFLQVLTSYGQHPAQSTYGLLFLDIDRFKRFNDMFGHHFGDMVLAKVVEVLKGMLRSSDVIGRFGGDEFLVLLSGPLDFADIERIASHVERRVASAVSSRLGTEVQASVGAAYCTSLTTASQALRAADAAMYGSKRRRPGESAVAVVHADRVLNESDPTAAELLVT